MDAYDIFKKLTKGLMFNNRVLGVKTANNLPKAPKNESKPTDEPLEQEINYNSEHDQTSESEHDRSSESEHDRSSESEREDPKENEFELLQGVTIGPKKKKRKPKDKSEELKKKLELQEQNHFRNQHGIRVVGRHIPAALPDFSDLVDHYKVSEDFVNTIKECGYVEPTPIQRQVLTCMLENRQILACAPTGSGKTAAFLIPILHALGAPQGGPRALILCPTRELAKQIHREALRLSASTNLRCSVVNKIQESKIKERESTIKKSDIVISTPNRLCYLLNQENVNITLDKVKWLIIDEADKLFEGSAEQDSDFRQQLEQIMTRCDGKERRVAMFSATHTPTIGKWCRHNLRGLINITVGQRNAATELVDQELLYCGNESGKLVAFRQLIQQGLKPPVLVFVQSKDRAKQLFKELIYDGINVDVIHADRTQTQRDNVVRSFRVGKIWVLICTELMGRGIDFRGVNLVINFDFPPSAISYIHRIGRAGRAGQRGRAITFFTQDDVVNLRSIAAVMKQSGCSVPEYMLKLKQDPNKRKKLMKKAPHREKISTILEKKPDKRKLEDVEKQINGEASSNPKRKRRKLNTKTNNTNKKKVEGKDPQKRKHIKKVEKKRKA